VSMHDYLGVVWIVASATLWVWACASAVTYYGSPRDRTRSRLLVTVCLVLTSFVIGDIARLRWRWEPFGLPADADAWWLAVYRSCWAAVLIWATKVLYWARFRAWVAGRGRR
jgi:hypothetical protein